MFIAFDMGATKTRVASSFDGIKIFEKREYTTIRNYRNGYSKLLAVINELSAGKRIKFVGGSVAAVCSKNGKYILSSTRLKDWIKKPFAKELSEKFKSPSFLANDACCAALSEAIFGAGKGKRIVLYFTISTGINGACVTDGIINSTKHNFQFGHQIIHPNGKYWRYCGQKGCLESYASGIAFEKTFGIKPENCYDKKIWDKFASKLAVGVVNVIVMHSPEIVVIGGGISKAGAKLFKPLKKHVKNNLKIFQMPKITPAKLGDNNGLIGALLLARQQIYEN